MRVAVAVAAAAATAVASIVMGQAVVIAIQVQAVAALGTILIPMAQATYHVLLMAAAGLPADGTVAMEVDGQIWRRHPCRAGTQRSTAGD